MTLSLCPSARFYEGDNEQYAHVYALLPRLLELENTGVDTLPP